MKKLFVLFLAIAAMSCSDDSNDHVDNGLHDPYTGSVVGNWQTVALSVDGEAVDLNCDIENPYPDNYLFKFYEDNTFEIFHTCYPDEGPYASGTYSTTGNVLTLNMNGQTGKAHMVDHLDDNNKLEFRFTISSDGLFYNYYFTVQEVPPTVE